MRNNDDLVVLGFTQNQCHYDVAVWDLILVASLVYKECCIRYKWLATQDVPGLVSHALLCYLVSSQVNLNVSKQLNSGC